MGHEILYCFKCRTQLRASDFEKGAAHRIDANACCAKCAPEAIKSLPPDKVAALLKQIAAAESSAKSETRRDPSKSTRRAAAVRPEKQKGLAAAVGGAVLLLVVVLAFLLRGKGEEPRRPAPEPPVAQPKSTPTRPPPAVPEAAPSVAAPSKREEAARESLRKARDYQKANPQDFAGQAEILQQAVWVCERTGLSGEAAQELDAVRKQELVSYQNELAALDRDSRAALNREDLKGAFAILRGAEARHPGAQWKLLLGRKTRDLNDQSWKLFDALKEEALAARQKGNSNGVEKIRQRIALWSIADYTQAFEKALGDP
jgi:hypothetical protein